jgi:glyoxylate carboligase
MRANEFVNEGKKAKKLPKTYRSSGSGMDAYTTGSDPYHKYRMGVAAAGAPDMEHVFNASGPSGSDMVSSFYSSADEEIMNVAAKAAGLPKRKLVSRGSKELDGTHTVSPVANWNKK